MSDGYSNTQVPFNNCAATAEVKEPIKALVLTDDECRKIKLGRSEMLKVVEPVQIKVMYFVVTEKTRFLHREAIRLCKDPKVKEKEYDKYGNPIPFTPTKIYKEMERYAAEECYKKYEFYPSDVLKSLTRAWTLEDVYKIVTKQKKIPKHDILSGEDESYNEFKYKGKLIFDTPDKQLPYTELVEKKYDPKSFEEFRKKGLKEINDQEKKIKKRQDPITYDKIKYIQDINRSSVQFKDEPDERYAKRIAKTQKTLQKFNFLSPKAKDWELGLCEYPCTRIGAYKPLDKFDKAYYDRVAQKNRQWRRIGPGEMTADMRERIISRCRKRNIDFAEWKAGK